jgi:hypothetical protein
MPFRNGSHLDASLLQEPTSFDLLSPGPSSKLTGAKIIVSCAGSNEAVPSGDHAISSGFPAATTSADATVITPEQDLAKLEYFVRSAAGSSELSATSGIEIAGTVISAVTSAATSDSFKTVMGFLEKFVQIGDAIAEVSG